MFEAIYISVQVLLSVPFIVGLSYIENHIKVHEYSTKIHDPRPRINKSPL